MAITRLSIPGNLCVHCDAVVTDSLVCPGCGHVDPLTKRPEPENYAYIDGLDDGTV